MYVNIPQIWVLRLSKFILLDFFLLQSINYRIFAKKFILSDYEVERSHEVTT